MEFRLDTDQLQGRRRGAPSRYRALQQLRRHRQASGRDRQLGLVEASSGPVLRSISRIEGAGVSGTGTKNSFFDYMRTRRTRRCLGYPLRLKSFVYLITS
ncbi:MAG: hypothetical protein OSA24_09120 [Longimicrobiales bacterium]|nr:hypothetical protein [Longimicrobiales bacterium]